MPEAENTPESKRSPLVLLANRVQAAHEQFVNTWGTSDWKTAGELKTSLRYGVIGFPIAIAGTVGYIVNGLGVADLPAYCLGYVYLPALAGIVAASSTIAFFQARVLPDSHQRRRFGLGFSFIVRTSITVTSPAVSPDT